MKKPLKEKSLSNQKLDQIYLTLTLALARTQETSQTLTHMHTLTRAPMHTSKRKKSYLRKTFLSKKYLGADNRIMISSDESRQKTEPWLAKQLFFPR